MALDATIGGASADSNVSVADADTYWTTRPNFAAWDALTTANKERSLKWATRLLDQTYTWNGGPVTTTQALRWPRSGTWDRDGDSYATTIIPQEVKDATAEFANLLAASDRYADPGTAGFSEIKVGPITLKIDPSDRVEEVPFFIRQMLEHLCTKYSSSSVKLVRT